MLLIVINPLLFAGLHPPSFFFFNDTATTEIYTLSLHDALPISSNTLAVRTPRVQGRGVTPGIARGKASHGSKGGDRKSTRLNSSHVRISYAVFCLKKKKTIRCSLASLSHSVPLAP